MFWSIASATPGTGNLIEGAPVQQAVNSPDNLALLGWALGFVIAAGVLTLVARPLLLAEGGLRRETRSARQQGQSHLEGLYERAATERKSLEELEFDHELGNLTEADYASLKQKTSERLAKLEEQIKQAEGTLATTERLTPPRRLPKSLLQPAKPTSPVRSAVVAEVAALPARPVAKLETEGRLRAKPAVRELMKCSECATPFKPGERFCAHCGAPLPRLCLNCGSEIIGDERFCKKCGAAVIT